MNCECLLVNLDQVTHKQYNIVFGFKRSNCIYDYRLLKLLLLVKATNISRLNKISLISNKFDNPNMIILCLEYEIGRFVTGSTIDQE